MVLLQCAILLLMFSMAWGQDSVYSSKTVRSIIYPIKFYVDYKGFAHIPDSTFAIGHATYRDSLLKWYDDYQYSLTYKYIQEMKWWIKSGRCGNAPIEEEPTFGGFMVCLRTMK